MVIYLNFTYLHNIIMVCLYLRSFKNIEVDIILINASSINQTLFIFNLLYFQEPTFKQLDFVF